MILIMVLLDMIGVASMIPFVTVLSGLSLIEQNYILNYMFQSFKIIGIENNK